MKTTLLDIIIQPGSATWWNMLLLSAAFIALPLLARAMTPSAANRIRQVFGILLLCTAIVIHPYLVSKNLWTLQQSLPLQLCSLSGLLSGIVLLFPSQRGYELLLFWGIPGAVHSLLTPEMTQGEGPFLFAEYYISHAGIILSALYLTTAMGMRPGKRSWLRIFLYSQLLLPLIGCVDYFLDANYMYLRERPEADNPLIIGPWPWYVLCFDFLLLAHMMVVYLMFRKKSQKQIALS